MIKWTVKDALQCLHELKNPFESKEQKSKFPQLTEVARTLGKGNGQKPIGV